MNGLPGPFIKYFLKELGHEGMLGGTLFYYNGKTRLIVAYQA